ncbi:hypothetical protein B0O99DRAFT_686409 [Bisporella sp. PMI_857]|nr:hypothetical protein B0O99DRAFT_686409 [Bisporella sp. PMI_857]
MDLVILGTSVYQKNKPQKSPIQTNTIKVQQNRFLTDPTSPCSLPGLEAKKREIKDDLEILVRDDELVKWALSKSMSPVPSYHHLIAQRDNQALADKVQVSQRMFIRLRSEYFSLINELATKQTNKVDWGLRLDGIAMVKYFDGSWMVLIGGLAWREAAEWLAGVGKCEMESVLVKIKEWISETKRRRLEEGERTGGGEDERGKEAGLLGVGREALVSLWILR